jgi:hypothetical protein
MKRPRGRISRMASMVFPLRGVAGIPRHFSTRRWHRFDQVAGCSRQICR